MKTAKPPAPFAGADERTPSRAQYFAWINNTWEGATEAQTLVNLDFFQWLQAQYGMQLDIYAWDAGTLDGGGQKYWKDDDAFRQRFPRGFAPSIEKALASGCRMGIWLGPDGFGDTPAQGRARQELLVSLCRDSRLALFKFDLACDGLRKSKQPLLAAALAQCRKHCPDLIVLNHRIDLGKAAPHATTYLWEGLETYIDVHMPNASTAPHHRAGALARGFPPNLGRLTEDHGVCLSSCMDRWDDDLVLQAFNRCLILAPEIYGNPWLLRDDEFPKLARLYNLHRRYRDILVRGIPLPEPSYGPSAVARGDAATRFLTLRNLTWQPVTYRVKLDRSIGLTARGRVELRLLHPHERILGTFPHGAVAPVTVEPFRACLLMATTAPCDELGVEGCDADVIRDIPGRPVELKLSALPGSKATVTLRPGGRTFSKATLDGKPLRTAGNRFRIEFPGRPLKRPWHRKLADLQPSGGVPDDAEALYEATCFAADNDALEVRSLRRAGPTAHPAVQAARDAFFAQFRFRDMGGWDRFLFDGDPATAFGTTRTGGYIPNRGPTSLRIDLGKPTRADRFVIQLASGSTVAAAECSADLAAWSPVPTRCTPGREIVIALDPKKPIRYLRIEQATMIPREAVGFLKGKPLPRDLWRASNLFAPYRCRPAQAWWSAAVTIDEAAPGSFLCIALHGEHGRDGAWAAARCNGRPVGCPDRAVSFDSNIWEADFALRTTGANYTYYLPLTPEMIGAKLDLVVLSLWLGRTDFRPEAWLTSLDPHAARTLVLE